MNTLRCIIVFFLLPFWSFAQKYEDIIGDWAKIKSEMADGSYAHKPLMEVSFTFNQDKTASIVLDDFEHKATFEIRDNIIFFSTKTAYKIEKLTKQELVITQIEPNVKPQNLYRYYLNRKGSFQKDGSSLSFAITDSDTIFYAKPNLIEPTFKGKSTQGLFPYLIEAGAFKDETSFKVRASFIIMKNDSIVVVKVESENEKININVTKALEKTKGFWKAAVVNNKRVSAFLDLVFEEQKDLKKNVPRANQLYEKGVKYYQKKQYEEAIEAFSESLVLYPNRDVYFDRAAVYLEKGENEKACLDWKILQDKGDKEAESLIKLYCK